MNPKRGIYWLLGIFLILGTVLSACSESQVRPAYQESDQLQVVATTTFVGDVLSRVGGDMLHVTVLLEPGQNPHAYQPSPQDMVRLTDADLIFSNGFGLEEFLPDLLEGAGNSGALVELSEGIDPLRLDAENHDHEEEESGNDHLGIDPHVWFDPNNIMVWTENAARALGEVDPEQAQLYQENAARYRSELEELDGWIREQVESIPAENRELVTDHRSFGYFAEEYDFEQIGAVIPAPTTEAETSGKELAELMETIQEHAVKAIFVSVDTDPTMADIVAEDTGVELVELYFGSLTAGGPADTYLEFMRYNVETITAALQD